MRQRAVERAGGHDETESRLLGQYGHGALLGVELTQQLRHVQRAELTRPEKVVVQRPAVRVLALAVLLWRLGTNNASYTF